MCELLGLSSNAPAAVNFSLPKLAEHGAVPGTYADGWGVGYYEGRDVRLFKEATAAAGSEWVRFIAQHDLRSLLVIAHTRRATRGTRSYPNAQPFLRELAGRVHLFAHNGDLPRIFDSKEFQPERFNPSGSIRLDKPTPSLPFAFFSTGRHRFGRIARQLHRSANDS
jgi:glutamine amidotransferase